MPTLPEQELSVGDRGMTLSRLSPMGKIEVTDGFTRPSPWAPMWTPAGRSKSSGSRISASS